MFTDFVSGGLDISDWPIQPGDLSGFITNPDFFVTPKLGDFGIFQLDLNHQDPFLGVGWQVSRSTTGGTTPATTGSPGFATGTPSLTVTNACTIPCNGFSLKSDSHIKFVDSPPAATPNAPGTWAPGKAVVYDIDGDGVYNAEGTPTDPVISGVGIPSGVNLSIDSKLRFVDDFPANSIWNSGEAVVYDANNNNIFDSGDTVIAGPVGHLDLVVHLKNIEEGGALIKDANNLVTITITSTAQPTAIRSDDGNPNPSGTYSGIGLLSIPPSYNISTTIYSGSALLSTAGSTPPVCSTGQQCNVDLLVNYNSPSDQKPSVAGIEIARSLSHLVDKPPYLTGPYLTPPGGTPLATCDDVQAPPTQSLMTSIGAGACDHSSSVSAATLQADCVEHADLFGTSGQIGGTTCSPVSLYNLKSDGVAGSSSCAPGTVGVSCFPSQSASPPPAGYSGTLDLSAACESLVSAGFNITGATGTTIGQRCTSVAQGTGHIANPSGSCIASTGVGCIIFYIRTHDPRKAFGTIVADELNYLFGTPAPGGGTICYGGPPSLACSQTPVYFTIAQVGNIVFDVTPAADWNLYTGGFTLTSTPDHLYSLYHSLFGSDLCSSAGKKNAQPNNYPLWCDPIYDTQANAGENVPGITLSGFLQAAVLGATRGATIPIYTGLNQFVALNAWNWQQVGGGTGSSLVTVKGHGFLASSGFLLNMRPVPGYTPSNSLYYASGCNPSSGCLQNVIRRGMSQTTLHLSPYTFTTAWEAEPLVQIYDTMLAVDPNTGGLCQTQPSGTAHCIDWMTTTHSTSFDSGTGLTTQQWNLRNDINFHDGHAVTAHDVCFSLQSYRDAPSANFFPSVSNLVSCTAVTNKIAQVVLTGQSPFNELNIGGVFILPEHVWGPLCGYSPATDKCSTGPAPNAASLASTSFDPVAVGDMVGSGSWVCNPAQGVSTIAGQASCTQNANGSAGGQAVAAGGRILLKRDLGYMRCCGDIQISENGLAATNLQTFEWADFNKDGKVTILDIAAAASRFGAFDPYFASPLYGANVFNATKTNGGLSDDIGDIATIAFFFDHGLSAPFLGTPNGYLSAGPSGLNQQDPQVDPYDLTVQGLSNQAYGNGAPSNWGKGMSGAVPVSGLAFMLQSNGAIPAGGSYTATIVSAPIGAPLNPCTLTGGGTSSDGTLGPLTRSFATGTTGPTALQLSFGHCFPSGTYVISVSYTPPGGSAGTFWTITVVKP